MQVVQHFAIQYHLATTTLKKSKLFLAVVSSMFLICGVDAPLFDKHFFQLDVELGDARSAKCPCLSH